LLKSGEPELEFTGQEREREVGMRLWLQEEQAPMVGATGDNWRYQDHSLQRMLRTHSVLF
jgi:hypothetical protein